VQGLFRTYMGFNCGQAWPGLGLFVFGNGIYDLVLVLRHVRVEHRVRYMHPLASDHRIDHPNSSAGG
jgi:hypothetical protein